MNRLLVSLGLLSILAGLWLLPSPSPETVAQQVRSQTVLLLSPMHMELTLLSKKVLKRDGMMSGSGVLYHNKGLVLTAAHCLVDKSVEDYGFFGFKIGTLVATRKALYVRTIDGVQAGCRELKVDRARDIGIIDCAGISGRSGVSRTTSLITRIGTRVVTSGYAGGGPHVLADGIVANDLPDKGKVMISAPSGPGMSGGGVFTYDGSLLGLIQAGYIQAPFTGFITSPIQLQRFLREFENAQLHSLS